MSLQQRVGLDVAQKNNRGSLDHFISANGNYLGRDNAEEEDKSRDVRYAGAQEGQMFKKETVANTSAALSTLGASLCAPSRANTCSSRGVGGKLPGYS
ncbi:unnamed protein product [Nezara viridula]|uniref:Uncharacterized protein n=1 Tax=Nezara viridula TaxID=85310 RepID=A0A9P0HCL0_NEZVI|nr:unnamed protein product [Nezara viridula]